MLLEHSTPITVAENQLNPGQQAAVNLLDTWEKTNEKWFLLEAAAGFGKEQPVSEPVLTPSGWTTMGSLSVGSLVIGSDGFSNTVTDIYPQGIKDIYTITFADGSKVRCGLDHLWTVKSQTKKELCVMPLSEILKDYIYTNSKKNPFKYSIPAFEGLQKGEKIGYAYALGYMLGNGCFSKGQLAISCHTNIEKDLLDALKPSLGSPTKSRNTSTNGRQSLYCWLKVDPCLLKYYQSGLSGDKRLLEDDNNWLTWDYNSRLELLKGLLDSDGCANNSIYDGRFRSSFSSSSETLMLLVRDLIRSLGGRCCEPNMEKRHLQYKSQYYAIMAFRMPICPFKLHSKKWVKPRFSMSVAIVNIEKEQYQEESVCIKVSAPDRLYITANFKLTHNSHTVKYWLNKNKHLKKDTVLTAPTHQALEQLAKDIPGVSAMTIHALLGYRPSATESEKQILVKARGGNDKRIDYRYVIIDEAFYVPKVLIKAIDEVYHDVRFIVLGDRKQLQAVSESQSALIDLLPFIKYKATLTQNMRSNCEFQKQLVLDVGEKGWNYDFTPNLITRAQVIKQMCHLIDQNQLDFLFIGYRHVVVDRWAETIRELIYDRGKEEFYQPGEVVRLSGVVDKDNLEVIRNNEVVKIVGACNKEKPEFIIVERDGGETVLLDLDYNGEIEQAKIEALKAKDSKLWTYYHRLVRTYPKISSAWAITAHSSQGCTVNNAWIDFKDLKREGSNELLLVAVSRSRELIKGFQ